MVVIVLASLLAVVPGKGADAIKSTVISHLKINVAFGHQAPLQTTLTPRLLAESPGMKVEAETKTLTVGAGVVDSITARVSWPKPTQLPRKPQSIWQYLFDHGEPGQVARLKEDPGLQPYAPVLTVQLSEDGTRGFSIALDQLIEHQAMWLPEQDAFVTLADSQVDFDQFVNSLKGERVLDRVEQEPESSFAEWTNKWEDFGNPIQWNKPWETTWLGARGHLTGLVARHDSLYKFGVDRWGNVRPDFASPRKFRLDVLWPENQWTGQRILDGLPILVTDLEREGQHCEIEQFAAPLTDAPPAKRGEVASVFFSKVRLTGKSGPINLGFRLTTESTNRHPELRPVGDRWQIVDRETDSVWLEIDPGPDLNVEARPSIADEKDPHLDFDIVGELTGGEIRDIILKLASPPVLRADRERLAKLDFAAARSSTINYWEHWLAQGAQFEVPEQAVNDLFRANLWHALTLPRFRTDIHGVDRIDLPYSNFAYGQLNADWPINQAVYVDYMLYGLRGYFGVADEEFAAIYQSQQEANGRVGGFAEWGVYSPGMLYSIGQNFLLSRDRPAFERLLPNSLKTLDWCLAEVARGRTNQAAPGLIVAPLNDLTHDARAWAFPNAYFVAGLELFGRALAAYGHPRAAHVLAVARKMRTEVEREFGRASVRSPVVQLADGTWINYVPSDAMTPRRQLDVWYPTDVDVGPLHLARLSAIDPRGWLATAMLNDHEDNLFLDQWGAANEPVYNPQGTAYLRRDEPEAAIRTFYSTMACAFSHHQFTPLEHRWAWGQYTMPPSTDGAWFELYRNLLLNELAGDDTLFVGQAIPRAWLEDGKQIHIRRAQSYFGPVNIDFESHVDQGNIKATVEFLSDLRPKTLLVRFRHPEKKALNSVTVNGEEWNDFNLEKEWVRITTHRANRFLIVTSY